MAIRKFAQSGVMRASQKDRFYKCYYGTDDGSRLRALDLDRGEPGLRFGAVRVGRDGFPVELSGLEELAPVVLVLRVREELVPLRDRRVVPLELHPAPESAYMKRG
jgi:hypothetical protein